MMLLGGQAVRVLDLRLHADAIAAQASDAPGVDSESAASPDDIAYIVYTSGSTGKPKGVRVPHRTVVGFLDAITRELGLSGADRVLATTSPSFDPSILETFGTLMLGAHVIVASREQIQDPYALRALVESSGATVMQTTPSAWRMLIEAGWRGAPAFKAISGSEALSVDLACELLERAGEVWNLYGPTETTVWATAWRVHPPETGISIGQTLANTRIWVLDERRRRCPLGVPGEIYIGGRGVALGYVESPELTAEKFLESPFNPGERMYRTGDRGRWRPDGTLEFLGRRDFQLKVRGYRIEPGEVEAALAAHPQVGSTVVTAREVEPGDTRLVAYIVCRQTAPAAVELREHLRRELPEYMIPQHFVALDAMPRLPNGKIDRNGLPAPTLADAHARRGHVAPRTAEEIAIAGIWQQLLGVPRVDVTDNFFDLGGHSLLAMSVVARIEEALDVRLSPRQLVYESLEQVARAATRTREEPPAKARTGGRWFARWFGRRS
jgi:amino acid adenylation domain-containing protein